MGVIGDSLFLAEGSTNLSQEEIGRSYAQARIDRHNEDSREGMKEYAQGIRVGDHVKVKCDGPGPCTGWVASLTDVSINVYVMSRAYDRYELRKIDGCYLRAQVEKIDSYCDLVEAKMKYIKDIGGHGDTLLFNCGSTIHNGVIINFGSDTIIIMNESGEEECIPALAIREITVPDM